MDLERRPGVAGRGSRWWPPIWPSRSVPACRQGWLTPVGWPTRSMWCGSATVASIRCAAGCRTTRWATADASMTRCIGSASCCSPAANASTHAARTACCSACASATPTTSCSALGWPRNRCATSTSPTHRPTLRRCDAARQGHRRLRHRRGRRGAFTRPHARVVAQRDPRPPRHRRIKRADRRAQPVRQEGQALRPRLPILRPLPATRSTPRRRHHLAATPTPTTHPNPHSPPRRVESP